jgi:hypothetical protein
VGSFLNRKIFENKAVATKPFFYPSPASFYFQDVGTVISEDPSGRGAFIPITNVGNRFRRLSA